MAGFLRKSLGSGLSISRFGWKMINIKMLISRFGLKVKSSEPGDSGFSYLGFILFVLKYLKLNTTMEINFLPKTIL